MEQLLITIEGKSNVDLIMRLVSKFNFVKSISCNTVKGSVPVVESKQASTTNVVNEPVVEYNWINPTRPATDEEFEQMIAESEAQYEAGNFLTAKDAQEKTKQAIENWKKKNIR